MEERNSEGTLTKVMLIVAMVVVALAGAATQLSEAGLTELWPFFGTLTGIFGFASKMAWEYIRSRPEKHRAMAMRAAVDKGVDPTTPQP